jgi:hypothetical protein
MKGKIAIVLLSGLLFACAPTQPPAASAPPAPPLAPTPAAETVPTDRIVVIRRASCGDLLRLSTEDRAEAAMFYIGYQSSRFGAATVNVSAIPDVEVEAIEYCEANPDRAAAEAFAKAYSYFR